MAYLNANEPVNRFNEGNNAVNPVLMGAAAGGVLSGGIVGQSAMSYRNVPKKANKIRNNLDSRINSSQKRIDKLDQKAMNKMKRYERSNASDEKYGKLIDKYAGKIEPHYQNVKKLEAEKGKVSAKKMQEAHRYHKMGGLKNAGAIAGATAIGAATGYVADRLNN